MITKTRNQKVVGGEYSQEKNYLYIQNSLFRVCINNRWLFRAAWNSAFWV